MKLNGKSLKVHRIIYEMVHGECPEFLDHINGIRDDNRLENLRPCTLAENSRNNKSKGYYFNKQNNKWHAQVQVRGKKTHLGFFEDEELAELVVAEARATFYGEFARQEDK